MANSHTSGISLEISLGIHHKRPDLSLNSITPLSVCEMQPGWIWSFLLWLVDETMWEIFPENWEGFTPALQPPRCSRSHTRFLCLSPNRGSCPEWKTRLWTSLWHVRPARQWPSTEPGGRAGPGRGRVGRLAPRRCPPHPPPRPATADPPPPSAPAASPCGTLRTAELTALRTASAAARHTLPGQVPKQTHRFERSFLPQAGVCAQEVLRVARTSWLFAMASVLFMCKAHSVTAEKVRLMHKAPAGSGHRGSDNAGAPAPLLGTKSNAKWSGTAAPNSRKPNPRSGLARASSAVRSSPGSGT